MKLRIRQPSRRRAVILILTMWIVVVLMLLAHSLAFEMQVETKLARAHRGRFQAEQLARLGVSRAICDLRNDRLIDGAIDRRRSFQMDGMGDIWAGSLLPRELELDLDDTGQDDYTIEYLVIDEESRININGLGPQRLKVVQSLLMLLDVEEDDALDLATAIQDWADADALVAGGVGDNETTYYTGLLREKAGGRLGNEDMRFLPKNDFFRSVDELLALPGMTPELFYGYDPEEDDDPDFFPVRHAGESRDRHPALRDLVTVRGENKININTVGFYVLAAICAEAAGDLDSGRSMAEDVINHRQGNTKDDFDNNSAFRALTELSLVNGMSPPMIAQIRRGTNLTTRSDYFTIYSRAQVGERRERIMISGSSRTEGPPRPSARIVAECRRQVVFISREEVDGGEDWAPPGYSPQSAGNRAIETGICQYYIPIVYVKSWCSY